MPSFPVSVIDVPEVKKFDATFKYNFFAKDESINDKPVVTIINSSTDVTEKTVNYSLTRIPRFVLMSLSPPLIFSTGHQITDISAAGSFLLGGDLKVSQHVSDIISEDQATTNKFVAVDFHDNDLYKKLVTLMSSSIGLRQGLSNIDASLGTFRTARAFSTISSIDADTISHASRITSNPGVNFFSNTGNSENAKQARAKFSLTDDLAAPLSRASTHSQIGTKFIKDMIAQAIRSPRSLFMSEFLELYKNTQSLSNNAKSDAQQVPTIDDFKLTLPFAKVEPIGSTTTPSPTGVKVIGFIIDKFEINDDGSVITCDPVTVDVPHATLVIDPSVKYGSTYRYSARTIVQLTMPVIDDDTDEVMTAKFLISSRPSTVAYVTCTENEPPPPPSNINFVWNFETDELAICWELPINPQRDIKKFQVFRRKTVKEPYQLVKMYDFDDSALRYYCGEDPDARVLSRTESAVTSYIDDDFDRTTGSRYIYAVASIDAHGMTSGYSEQYEVWFDNFKNKILQRLISHSGAPKPYPNMYLNKDLFIDTMRVSGPSSKKMKLYFNPEYYHVTDDAGRTTKVISTLQDGGSYQFNVVNLDSQKGGKIAVTIDDRTENATNGTAQINLSVKPSSS